MKKRCCQVLCTIYGVSGSGSDASPLLCNVVQESFYDIHGTHITYICMCQWFTYDVSAERMAHGLVRACGVVNLTGGYPFRIDSIPYTFSPPIFLKKIAIGVATLPNICYFIIMEKRHNENKRPLCIANNNTCTNLAGIKGRDKPHLGIRYHTRCDTHRRNGHDARAFRNSGSKRYIPLNKCNLCNDEAKDRHRIISGSDYAPEKVLTLCKPCHKKIHLLYKELGLKGYIILTK